MTESGDSAIASVAAGLPQRAADRYLKFSLRNLSPHFSSEIAGGTGEHYGFCAKHCGWVSR